MCVLQNENFCFGNSQKISQIWYHRIIEYSEWEGTNKDHRVLLLALCRTTPRVTPYAWEHCPNASGTLSGSVLWPLPGQPIPVLNHPLGEEVFPDIKPKLPNTTSGKFLRSCHYSAQRNDQCLPLLFPSWWSCALQWGLPSVSSTPGWTDQVSSATPHMASPPEPSPSLLPSSGCSLIL